MAKDWCEKELRGWSRGKGRKEEEGGGRRKEVLAAVFLFTAFLEDPFQYYSNEQRAKKIREIPGLMMAETERGGGRGKGKG